MMALEQTKYCCFKQISNARQAFIIFLSLKSSKFLNFWRLFFFLSSFKYCGPKNKCHIVLFGLRKHFQGITTATLIFAQFFQGENILLFCSQKSKAKRKIFVKELQQLYSCCLNCWRLCSSSASNIGHQRLHNHLPYMVDISAFQHSKANKETLIARSLNRLKVSH